MVLEWLYKVEVRTFSLGETVLTIEEEFSADDGILTPAMHVESSFGENECACIGDTRVLGTIEIRVIV